MKLGGKVGVDLLLYPTAGPTMTHAHYGVSIRMLESAKLKSNNGLQCLEEAHNSSKSIPSSSSPTFTSFSALPSSKNVLDDHETPIEVGSGEALWSSPWSVPSRVLDSVAKSLLMVIVEEDGTVAVNDDREGSDSNGNQAESLISRLDFSGFSIKELVLSRWQSTLTSKT